MWAKHIGKYIVGVAFWLPFMQSATEYHDSLQTVENEVSVTDCQRQVLMK